MPPISLCREKCIKGGSREGVKSDRVSVLCTSLQKASGTPGADHREVHRFHSISLYNGCQQTPATPCRLIVVLQHLS